MARYADSDGYESDADRPHAYHYRDFVIRALNDDLPFDTFVRWQLAGDEIEPDNPQAVAATGFLTAAAITILPPTHLEEERLRNRYNELDDMLSTIGTGMLGLTLGCARCHDHKYDAISSREYYRLLAALHSGDRQVVKLAGKRQRGARVSGPGRRAASDLALQPRRFLRPRPAGAAWAFWTCCCASGRPTTTGPRPAAIRRANDTTYQRKALADWITDVEHGAGALLARVIVNRVWQHHFGEGLVRTVSDFGVRSEAPSHPELLEWLANDFVANGWKLKRLHRLILTSAVYQQGGRRSRREQKAKIDPDNRLLWQSRRSGWRPRSCATRCWPSAAR